MSKENVRLFYEALAKDKALQAKFQAIGKKYADQKLDDKQVEAIYQKELVPLAKEAGYNYTLAELKAYATEAGKPVMREVSEEELAGVAGGGVCVCPVVGIGDRGGGNIECSCVVGGGGNLDGGMVDCVCVLGGGG